MVLLGILLSTAALASAQHQPLVGAAARHGTNADVDASSRPTARAGINASYSNPILAGNWPDPGALRVNGSYFVATTGGGFAIHRSDDSLASWALAGSVFDPEGGGGGAPTWASGDFWAPEIHQMVGGGYCVYFTARDKAGLLSIGVAIGPTPLGPFTDSGQPLARDDEGHGMYLDAHYFHDAATATTWSGSTAQSPRQPRPGHGCTCSRSIHPAPSWSGNDRSYYGTTSAHGRRAWWRRPGSSSPRLARRSTTSSTAPRTAATALAPVSEQ